MIPSPKESGRFPALDGIRALAILMVMYFHFWQQNWLQPPRLDLGILRVDFYPIASVGFLGVELLFVLSGFLLFLPLASGKKPHWPGFFRARFFRIFPCYALCVLVCGAFAYGDFPSPGAWLAYVTQNLLFLNTFHPSLLFNAFNSVLWSTSVEVWFYLVFPFIALAMLRWPVATALAAFALANLYRLCILPDGYNLPVLMNQVPGMLDCFVGGMFTAYLVAQARKAAPSHRGAMAVALAGAALFLFVLAQIYWRRGDHQSLQYYQTLYRPFLVMGACLLIGGAAYAPPLFQRIVGNPALAWVGALSFNLYLWHQWIAVKLREWGFPPYTGDPHEDAAWQWQHMLLCWILAFAAAALVTYAFDLPLRRHFSKSKG